MLSVHGGGLEIPAASRGTKARCCEPGIHPRILPLSKGNNVVPYSLRTGLGPYRKQHGSRERATASSVSITWGMSDARRKALYTGARGHAGSCTIGRSRIDAN